MPNEINIYEPRTMAEVVRRTPPVHTFFLDTFFKSIETYPTEKIDVDFVKGGRKLAPFVHKVIGGKVVPNSGYTTETFEPPVVAPERLTTIDDILKRSPGESLYNTMSPAQRATLKMSEDFNALDQMITRREEWMAVQSMLYGEIPIKGEGLDYAITFGFSNKETIVTDISKWSDYENSDPIADIERYKAKVQENGYVNTDILIMGKTALRHFLNNKKVKDALDVEHMNLAVIDPKELINGATYVGYLKLQNISIYTYNELYLDDWTNPETPETKPLIPGNMIVLASTQANYKRIYAGVVLIDQKTDEFKVYEATRVPYMYTKINPARRFLQLYSRPLPVPREVDTWFSATVCDADE